MLSKGVDWALRSDLTKPPFTSSLSRRSQAAVEVVAGPYQDRPQACGIAVLCVVWPVPARGFPS